MGQLSPRQVRGVGCREELIELTSHGRDWAGGDFPLLVHLMSEHPFDAAALTNQRVPFSGPVAAQAAIWRAPDQRADQVAGQLEPINFKSTGLVRWVADEGVRRQIHPSSNVMTRSAS